MKIRPLAASIFSTIVAISSINVYAEEPVKLSKKEAIASGKSAALFTSAAVAGAIAGGPIGFIVGAAGAALIGEDLMKGARTEDTLDESQKVIANYEEQLLEAEVKIVQLEQAKAERLEFQVHFTTGDHSLSHQDIQRINSLASYLKKNPELKVRLDGHADPRGEDNYNDSLSEERALTVVNALNERGVDTSRIHYKAHGSALSSAYTGDLEAYALERRVKIEVYPSEEAIASY